MKCLNNLLKKLTGVAGNRFIHAFYIRKGVDWSSDFRAETVTVDDYTVRDLPKGVEMENFDVKRMKNKEIKLSFTCLLLGFGLMAVAPSAAYAERLKKVDGSNEVENIGSEEETFTGYEAESGGAIYNEGTIGTISGTYENNKAQKENAATGKYVQGGAIYNKGKITEIKANFENNSVSYENYVMGQGGAIYNEGEIGSINGNFTGNNARSKDETIGGAIYNYNGKIGSLNGEFSGNFTESTGYTSSETGTVNARASAGAIRNNAEGFNNEYDKSAKKPFNKHAYGSVSELGVATNIYAQIGAIGNASQYALFNENHATGLHSIYGGAIRNNSSDGYDAEIGAIYANFYGNYVEASDGVAHGGAILNTALIGSVNGDFENNYAIGVKQGVGGAIRNDGSSNKTVRDGKNNDGFDAIIGKIIGNFINNSATATGGDANAGAINNEGSTIGYINGHFEKNYASGTNSAFGGAIYNVKDGDINSTIGNISGKDGGKGLFSGNYVVSANGSAQGGAVWNGEKSSIGVINSDFTGNYAEGKSSNGVLGGAIYNVGTIGGTKAGEISISGKFSYNSATNASGKANGGAIYNTVALGDIKGDFLNNSVTGTEEVEGGAIYNSRGSIGNITGNFEYNSAVNIGTTKAYAGAIRNEGGKIGLIKGNFKYNYASAVNGNVFGGAIRNNDYKENGQVVSSAEITGIEGNFVGNYVTTKGDTSNGQAHGGAILNISTIGYIIGDFIGNYAKSESSATKTEVKGGAIRTQGTITSITGNFSENSAQGVTGGQGGAIQNEGGTISSLAGDFTNNYASATNGDAFGGAIYNTGTIKSLAAEKDGFSGNYVSSKGSAQGGAIYNTGTLPELKNMSFTENYASSTNGTARGGAIYTNKALTISADGEGNKTKFNGNYVVNGGEKTSEAVYMDGVDLTLKATNGGVIEFGDIGTEKTYSDNINGHDYTLYITGDDTKSHVSLAGLVQGAKSVELEKVRLNIGTTREIDPSGDYDNDQRSWVFKDTILNAKSGIVDLTANGAGDFYFKQLNSGDAVRYAIDIGPVLGKGEYSADKFYIEESSTGDIKLSSLNVTADMNDEEEVIIQIIHMGDKTGNVPQLNHKDLDILKEAQAKMGTNYILVDGENGDFGLYTTDTENDSIKVRGLKNLLAAWGEFDDVDDEGKVFTLVGGTSATLGRQIEKLLGKKITIVGNDGKINLQGFQMFDQIDKNQEVTLNDVEIVSTVVNTCEDGDENCKEVENKTVEINNSGKLTLKNVTLHELTELENNGTLGIEGGTYGGEYANNSEMTVDKAIFNSETVLKNDGNLKVTNSTIRGGEYTNNSTMVVSGTHFGDDTVLENNGALEVTNGLLLGKYTNNKDMTVAGFTSIGDAKDGGDFTNAQNATLDIKGEKVVVYGDLENNGDITVSGKKGDVALYADVSGDGNITINNNNTVHILGNMSGQVLSAQGTSETVLANLEGFKENDLVVKGGTVKLSNTADTNWSEFSDNTLDLQNGKVELSEYMTGDGRVVGLGLDQIKFDKLNLSGGVLDVKTVMANLAEKIMGTVWANSFSKTADNNAEAGDESDIAGFASVEEISKIAEEAAGYINISNIIVTADAKSKVTNVLFTNTPADVKIAVNNVMGPIYQYDVDYKVIDDNGYVVFSAIDFNPEIHADSVAQLTGGYAAMLQVFDYAFEHADRYSALPKNSKLSGLCDSVVCAAKSGALPPYYGAMASRGVWVKPYSMFENMPLKNGPRVETKMYGTLVGADSNLVALGDGWYSALTGYIGSNHTQQSYDTVRTKLKSALAGVTQSFYKDKFYTAVTVSGGYTSGDTTTTFGKDHIQMKMGGVASKSGYNIEFADGKYVIQPGILMSYTALKANDYTAASGVHLKAKTTDIVQVNPQVKFIYNMDDGWQSYAVAGMVYNNGKTDVTADDVDLPDLSIKPYAEYGVGVQKLWDDKVSGYGQAMFHSGGRSGATFTAGFRYAF